MNKRVITVVIPVYNVEAYINNCLNSVAGQSYKETETILIDDGSIDGSPAICDEFIRDNSSTVCIHQRNRGVSVARNVGIVLGSGQYYHFLDSDDYMDIDSYEHLSNLIDEQGVDAVGFEYYVTYIGTSDIPHEVRDEHYGLRDRSGAVYEHLFGSSNFLCTKLLPASIVKNQRLRTDIYRDEDTLFGLDVLNQVNSCYFSKRPLLHYVQSEESACRGAFRVNQLTALDAIPIMEKFLTGEYECWLNQWRKGYMHLMATLYRDMYLDGGSYNKEKQLVHRTFLDLWRKGGASTVKSKRELFKFSLFRIVPGFYCWLSKVTNKL